MLIYSYQCVGCEYRKEEMRNIDGRLKSVACPRCSNEMVFIFTPVSVHTWRDLELELETNKPRVFESKKELKKECNRLGKSMPAWDI